MGTFRVARYIDDEPFRPRYNIPPSANILTVRLGADDERELVRLKWGFVPHWAKDLKGPKPCNARAETVAEKPLFRDAFKRQRCIVPVDAFYEWQNGPNGKQPYCYRRHDEQPFGIAGIWSHWKGEAGKLETVSLVVTSANDLMTPIHDRVPVIIEPDALEEWLDLDLSAKAAQQNCFRHHHRMDTKFIRSVVKSIAL